MGRRTGVEGESAVEREEAATRWLRIVEVCLIPACDPGDSSLMIRRLDAARAEVKKLRKRLERAGLAPTEIAAQVRAELVAGGFERLLQQPDRAARYAFAEHRCGV